MIQTVRRCLNCTNKLSEGEICLQKGYWSSITAGVETQRRWQRRYEAIVLGSSTYFSNVAWQIKKVIDESIVHYGGDKLKGKVAGIFASAGTSRDGKDC